MGRLRRWEELQDEGRTLGGRVAGQGEGRSQQTLPFELLHGYGAERDTDFHYCISSFRAIGLWKMPPEELCRQSPRAFTGTSFIVDL